MPFQARLGDYSMGHWIGIFYFPPKPLIEASNDTFACFKRASRVGDKAEEHFAWIYGIIPFPFFKHQPVAATGDPIVYINSKQAFRIMDSYSCGDIQAQGCDLVEVNLSAGISGGEGDGTGSGGGAPGGGGGAPGGGGGTPSVSSTV